MDFLALIGINYYQNLKPKKQTLWQNLKCAKINPQIYPIIAVLRKTAML